MTQWQKLVWNNLNTESKIQLPPTITNYKSNLDRIHIAYYQPDELDYNYEVIGSAIPEATGIKAKDYFLDAFMFHEDDHLLPGDWILCWKCNDDGYPRKRGSVYWMYVHYVVSNGVHDDTYTKLACEAKHLFRPTEPFRLDKSVKEFIRNALSSDKFPELLSLDDDAEWKLAPADKVVPSFLNYLRNRVRKEN